MPGPEDLSPKEAAFGHVGRRQSVTDSDEDDTVTGLARSSPREFGHTTDGFAVEFNFAGFACRSLTVETEDEAGMIKQSIESRDGTSGARVVIDR